MNLETKQIGDVIEIFLAGRLGVQNSIFVEQEIHRIIQSEPGCNILLNLAEVKYISSSGIRIFVSTMRVLKESGKLLKICNMDDSVKKIFEIVELMDMFQIYEDEEDALRAYKSANRAG